jgi:hypothetical protein
VDIDVDTIVGNHWVTIDLSDNTDAGFYANGSRYQVRMEGVTIDGATINAWIGAFSIGCTLRPTTAGRTLDVNATGDIPVLGTLADAAADGDPTATDTLRQYVKQLVNVLVGSVGIPAFPAAAAPANDVSLAEVIRSIYNFAVSSAAWGSINSGIVFRGTVTAADPGVSFTVGGLAGQGVGAFVDATTPWYAYVFRDAGGAGAAPQGEQQQITGYTSATGLFTTNAFTVPVAVSDDVIVMSGRIAAVPDILEDTATTIPATLASILADTNELQSDDIPATLATIAGYLDTEIAAILEDTGTSLPATLDTILNHATSGTVKIAEDVAAILVDTGTTLPATLAALNNLSAADVNAEVVDTLQIDTPVDGKSIVASMRITAAAAIGKVSGAGTGTEVFKGLDGSTTRATVTVDASGNRTGVTYV